MVLIASLLSLLLASSAAIASPAGTSKQCTPRDLKKEGVISSATTGKTTTTMTKSSAVSSATSSSSTIAKLKAAYSQSKIINFSTLTSTSQLEAQGLSINTGWGIGSTAPDGGHCSGSAKNIAIKNETLQLIVPGGQKKGGPTTGAELTFGSELLGGVFGMVAQLDGTAGTCQSMFTYHSADGVNDEQDIEVLGRTISKTGADGTPPGIELTNYNAAGDSANTIIPFPNDPTNGFHTYTLAWVKGGTRYFYDGIELKAPSQYSAVNPSLLIINHWTNGDPGFTAGPPTKDTVMKVKSVEFHYSGK